ncbi:MAG TPA: MBL fold metallo-hydrolase, partial [Arthrobacter sp.]
KPVSGAQAWDAATLRALPGRPEAVALPGHTPGNAALLLPAAGVIAVGDSFVTGHPISRSGGPQMLHRMYHSDPAEALAVLRKLEGVDASVILPGYGPAVSLPLGAALAAVRGRTPGAP